MMAEAGPESSSQGMIAATTSNDLNVHIKQELDNGPCCSPSPSTMQSHASNSEKSFNNKNGKVRLLPGHHRPGSILNIF